LFENGCNDLGDHFARSFDDDPITRPDVLPPNVLLVVKGRELDRGAAYLDRLKNGVGIQAPRSPYIDLDGEQPGRRKRRRELVGDCPSWLATTHHPQLAMEGKRIDLHD